jgi:hypothetical protein
MRIKTVEVLPCRLPFRGTFKIAGGAVGKPGERVPHIFVRIRDEDGLEGWGEARPSRLWSYETEESVTTTLRNYLAPAIVGQSVFDLANVHRVMNREIAGSVTVGQPIAKSAIDTALHDLICKRSKVTLRQFARANHRIQKSSDGVNWTVIGGGFGTGLGQFKNPEAVGVSADGQTIFVADKGNNRAQKSINGGQSWTLFVGSTVVQGPQGVAVTRLKTGPLAGGNSLVVSDTGNYRVLGKKDPDLPGEFTLLGGAGSAVGQFVAPGKIR